MGGYAWCNENSGGQTHPVAKKQPNAWGLYDMHGNVLEWCQDWFRSYPSGSVTDPAGPLSGNSRVSRGGNWRMYGMDCRVAQRGSNGPDFKSNDLGFRLARTR
jgi:formylglycine-generating enzyme required for sulfatase activity